MPSSNYRPWLPAERIATGVAALPMRGAVREWSQRWFAGASADVVGDPAPMAASLSPEDAWHSPEGLSLYLPAAARARTALLLFGPPDDEAVVTSADRAALDAAADACLGELRTTLARSFRLDTARPWTQGAAPETDAQSWAWRVAAGAGDPLLRIVASETFIARYIRAALPPVKPVRTVQPLAQALRDKMIQVSARVGAGRLRTVELSELAAGDVLVLDRDLTAAVDVAINDRPKPMTCTIDSQPDGLRLIIA